MAMRDTATGYGWISIALHWAAACVILSLWFIGNSLTSPEMGGYADMVHTHTTLAVSAYALLWFRIWWRLKVGHPGPLPRQEGFSFELGKVAHYLMLAGLGVMLVSGPLMAWSLGEPIHVYALRIPSPYGVQPLLRTVTHTVHVWGANLIIFSVLLHVLGVIKHAAFNRDGTFDKMMVAAKEDPDAG